MSSIGFYRSEVGGFGTINHAGPWDKNAYVCR